MSEGRTVVTSGHRNKILFVSSVDRDLNIFVMDEDGTNVQRLTSHLSGDFDAKFSPDGEKIAFTSRRDGYTNIHCMDADGSNVHQLTSGESIDVMGSWSPDGRKMLLRLAEMEITMCISWMQMGPMYNSSLIIREAMAGLFFLQMTNYSVCFRQK